MNTQAHTNIPLTKLSVAYDNQGLHIAAKIAPRIKVARDIDSYYVYDSHFRVADDQRAPGTPSNRVTFDASLATYHCDDYALHDVITPRQLRNTDKPIKLQRDSMEFLTGQIKDNQEVRCAALLFTTSSWTNSATLAAGWNDYTSDVADPVAAVETGAIAVMKGGANVPNVGVMGRDVLTHLKNNYRISERMKYTQRDIVTPDIVAAMFEINKLYVGAHLNDTTNEGQTASPGFTWGDDLWLGYIDPNPGLKTRTAFAMVSSGGGRKVKIWKKPELEDSEVVEVSDNYQFIQPLTGAGYLIKDTDASG